MKKANAHLGISLLEIIIVLSLVGILLVTCLPMQKHFMQHHHLEQVEKELLSALYIARNQALLTGAPMRLQPISRGLSWSEGLRLCTDQSKKNYLSTWHWTYPEISVEWHGFLSNKYIIFSSDPVKAATSGHFLLFLNDQVKKKIVLNRLGRIKIIS